LAVVKVVVGFTSSTDAVMDVVDDVVVVVVVVAFH
jgi:hypothetical protein